MKSIKLENKIEKILEEHRDARTDDMVLYVTYINGHDVERTFKDKQYRKNNDIATFGAVERCARKIKADRPELKANDDKKQKQRENYIAYGLGYNVDLY